MDLRKRRYCTRKVPRGKKMIPLYKATWSQNVMLGPSNVSGLGVFTTKKIIQGETVCIYSGDMTMKSPAGHSNFVFQGKLYNKETKKHMKRYLDAKRLSTAIGRFMNDACDGYSDSVPEKYRTRFYNNCGFRYVNRGVCGSRTRGVCGTRGVCRSGLEGSPGLRRGVSGTT